MDHITNCVMKYCKKIMPVMLAVTLALSVVALSTRQMAVSAETKDIDIDGVVGQFTLDKGGMAAVMYEVSRETGEKIDEGIAEAEEINKADGEPVEVDSRDWSEYSSSVPRDCLSSSELAFYDRLTELSKYYMDNSTIDGYYVRAYNTYCINGVLFNDLDLSSQEAFYVAQWFVYENPQYYFLKPTFLITSSAVYVACQDVVVDGDDRAAVTNEIFSGVDDMVAYVESKYSSDYDIEKFLHDLVCGTLSYKRGPYDQSIYSAMYEGETVCAGYAGTLSVLLNKAGIDTVTGLSDCHAWNEVYLNDEWYGVDVTWDDSLGTDIFFDVCDETLKSHDSSDLEHTIETSWRSWTPELSLHDYGSSESSQQEIKLVAPTVSSETIDDTAFRIVWSVVPDATSYELGLYSDPDYQNCIITKSIVGYKLKISSLKPGTTYYYRVRAVRSSGNDSIYSEYSYGNYYCPSIDEQAPATESQPEEVKVSAPANICAEDIDSGSFRLKWDSAGDGVKYDVGIYNDEKCTSLLVSGITKNPFIKISGLKPAQTVYASVRSVLEKDGTTYYSDYVILPYTVPEPDPVVPVLNNLSVTDVTSSSVKVSWDPVDNAQYELEISKYADFVKVLAKGTTSKCVMNIKGLSEETQYYIRVRAVVGDDWSEWSIVDVVTKYDEPVIPAVPSDIVVSDVNATSAFVSWTPVANAQGYIVAVSPFQQGATQPAASAIMIDVSQPQMHFKDLQDDTAYQVFVQSYVSKGGVQYKSDWSKPFRFVTSPLVTLSEPDGFVVTNVGSDSAHVKWNAADCDGYDVILKIPVTADNEHGPLGAQETVLDTKTSSNEIQLNGLQAATTYVLFVQAYKTTGGKTYYSDCARFDFETQSMASSLAAPANLSVVNTTASSFKVAWDSVPDSSKYRVEISKDRSFGHCLAAGNTNSCVMNVRGCSEGMTYYFRVKALSNVSGSDSDWSVIDVTTEKVAVAAPYNIKSFTVSDTVSRLQWNIDGNDPKCEVVIYGDAGHLKKLGSIVTANTSLKVSGMSKGKAYYFAVRTVDNVNGETRCSDWVNFHVVK